MVVIPPQAAAAVPDSKSSAVRVPPRSRSRWVWTSTPPGSTWSPRASISLAPGSRPSAMLAMRPCLMPRSATKVSVAVAISPPRITRSCGMTHLLRSGRRGDALGEAPRDRAAGREPDLLAVAHHVLEGPAQMAQPEGLADEERMQRDAEDQGLVTGLVHHLVEGVDDCLREGRGGAVVDGDHRDVVHLVRVRNAQDPAPARLHPHRLIVHRPVEQIGVPRFLQEIGRYH